MARTDQQAFLDAYLGGGISASNGRQKIKRAGSAGVSNMEAGANYHIPSLRDYSDDVEQVAMAYIDAAKKQQKNAAKAAQQAAKAAQREAEAARKEQEKAAEQSELDAEYNAAISALGTKLSDTTAKTNKQSATSSESKEGATQKGKNTYKTVSRSKVPSRGSDLPTTIRNSTHGRLKDKEQETEEKNAYSKMSTKEKMSAQKVLRTTLAFGTDEEKAQAKKELEAVENALWNDKGYLELVQKSIDDEPEQSRIDRYLDPSYKLNKLEEKDAKEIIKRYRKEASDAAWWFSGATDEQRREALDKELIAYDLEMKVSDLYALESNFAFAIPGVEAATNAAVQMHKGEEYNPNEDSVQAFLAPVRAQSPIASAAGGVGGTLASYAAGSQLVGAIPGVGAGLQSAGQAIGSTRAAQLAAKVPVLGKAFTPEAISGILGDQLVDTVLDTGAGALSSAVQGDKSGAEIAADAAKNFGTNLAFNIGSAAVLGTAGDVLNRWKANRTVPFLEDDAVNQAVNMGATYEPPPSLYDFVDDAAKAAGDADNAAQSVGNAVPFSLNDFDMPVSNAANDIPLPALENASQVAQSGADDVVNAWRSGTLTNAQLDTLKPGGVNRVEFEQATGVKLPDTSSGTRQFLRQSAEVPSLEPDMPAGTVAADNAPPSLYDGLPESIGAKRAQFERQEVPTRDVANQRDTLSGLDAQHAQDLGPQDNKTHIRYTNAEARADAEANIDIAIAEAGGNVRQGLDNEMRRLRDVGEEWGATDIETAKVVRDRLKQDYVSLEPGTVDYDLAKSRYNNWAREIAAHSSKAGLDLQQFKGEPLSTENVITRMQQYVAKKTEKWAKQHKSRAMQYEAMAKDLEQYADEMMNGTRSGLAVGMDEVKAGIQRIANARNLDVTEEQAARLAADIMTGQRQKAYYDKLLEFAGGFEDIDADVIQRVDELLFEAEKLPPNSRARVDIENQVYSVLADAIAPPAKFADKVSAWRYLAMLFNTRTHGRNNIGNVVMDGVSRIKENLAAKIEEFLLSEGNRTRATLSVGNEQDRALRGGAYQYANDMFYRQLSQNSRFNVEKGIEGGRRIFKTGWLENLRKGNNAALEGSDFRGVVGMLEPFANSEGKMGEFARKMLAAADEKGAAGKWALGGIQNNFANRMASYLKAKGYDASIFSATDAKSLAVLEEAAEVAKDSAFRTTFHEYSALADFLNKARDVKGLGFVADAAIPFTRTPVNIAKQGLRYSPVGLLDTFTRGIYQVKTGRISASEFIDKFATGLTGTGIMALGGLMGYYGLVRGKSSDETSDFDSMTGKQDYALDLGDWGTYTLDWLAPSSMPLLAGAELGRQIREEGKFSFLDFISALPKIGEPVLDTTMLQGLNGILESVRYADRDVPFSAMTAIGGELAKNYASQFVPTIAGQIARSIDPMRRQSYGGGDTPFERDAGYFLNSLENKVPGASMTNEAYVDPWGREQENVGGNFFGRLAYNTLSPGFYSAPNMTEVDQQLQSLYDATGVSGILPTNAPKYVKQDGSNVYFDAEQYHDFSVTRGEAAYDMVEDLLNNPMFVLLPQGTQAEILPELYTLANHIGAGEVLPDYETENKLYQIWQDDPEQVVPYLVGNSYIGQATQIKRGDIGDEDARLTNGELYSTIFGIEGMSTEEQARQYMNHASGDTVDKVYDAGGYDLVAKYAKLNALRSSMESQSQANDIYFLDYLGYSRAEKMALFRILWPKAKTNPWA